jgi:hypothetical protein
LQLLYTRVPATAVCLQEEDVEVMERQREAQQQQKSLMTLHQSMHNTRELGAWKACCRVSMSHNNSSSPASVLALLQVFLARGEQAAFCACHAAAVEVAVKRSFVGSLGLLNRPAIAMAASR